MSFLLGRALDESPLTYLYSIPFLSSRNLSNNDIVQNIPSEIGSLTTLIELDLGGNSLSGSIPSQVGSLTSLTVLDLANNLLTGLRPDLSLLIGLQTL